MTWITGYWLGRSSVAMTDRYVHGDQADLHDAVPKLKNFRSHFGHSVREVIDKAALATGENYGNTEDKWSG